MGYGGIEVLIREMKLREFVTDHWLFIENAAASEGRQRGRQ